MLRVLSPGAISPLFACEYPSVLQFVARRPHDGVIALGQQDSVAILDHENIGEPRRGRLERCRSEINPNPCAGLTRK